MQTKIKIPAVASVVIVNSRRSGMVIFAHWSNAAVFVKFYWQRSTKLMILRLFEKHVDMETRSSAYDDVVVALFGGLTNACQARFWLCYTEYQRCYRPDPDRPDQTTASMAVLWKKQIRDADSPDAANNGTEHRQ